jgi:hypothetical protein
MFMKMWRQGDIFIAEVKQIPPGATPLPHVILAHGEVTGHSHRLENSATGALYSADNEFFLEVFGEGARVVHDEHGPIPLEIGLYRVWRQREYTPERIVIVRD